MSGRSFVNRWDRRGDRLEVTRTSWPPDHDWRIVGRLFSPELLLVRDDDCARAVQRLLHDRKRDPEDLQYLILAKARDAETAQVGLKIEFGPLQAFERALAENVDLGKRHIGFQAYQRLHRDLDLVAKLLGEAGGEVVELAAGVVLIHGVISSDRRVLFRGRAAWRASLVDDIEAQRSVRHAAPASPEVAAS